MLLLNTKRCVVTIVPARVKAAGSVKQALTCKPGGGAAKISPVSMSDPLLLNSLPVPPYEQRVLIAQSSRRSFNYDLIVAHRSAPCFSNNGGVVFYCIAKVLDQDSVPADTHNQLTERH